MVDSFFPDVTCVHAADLDGDDDLDIIGAGRGVGAIVYWENTDGTGRNMVKHTLAGSFAGPTCVHAADVDGDGDMDILGAAYSGDEIAWWENLMIVPTATPTPTETLPPDAWLFATGGSGVIGTSGNLVPIRLDNPHVQVRGLSFILQDTPNALEATDVQTTARTAGLLVAFNDQGADGLEVVLTSLEHSAIATGTGAILQIVYDISPSADLGEVHLTFLDADAADPDTNPIPLGTAGGIFMVFPEPTPTPTDTPTPTPTPNTYLAAGVGSDCVGCTDATLDIILGNPDTEVRAVQLTLQDIPNRVEWTAATTTSRTTGFILAINDVATQGVEVVLSGLGDCIATGSGPIVTLTGTVDRTHPPETLTLEFTDVALADCESNPMEFRVEEGSFDVTATIGDVTLDQIVDLFDVLRVVDILLDLPPSPTEYEIWAADVLNTGEIDIFNLLAVIDIILA